MEQSKEHVFKCTACGNAYKNKQSLREHVRAEHKGVVYSCAKCTKKFKYSSGRNRHEKMCSMEQSKKYVFNCTACGNAYKDKQSLCVHVRAEHKGVVYSCSKCTKKFKYSTSRNRHEKTCSGEDHVCQICDKRCLTNYGLRRHLRIHKITPHTAPPRPQTVYSHTQNRIDTGNADEVDWQEYQRARKINLVMLDIPFVSNDSVPEAKKKSNYFDIDAITLSNDIRSISEKKMSTGDWNSVPRDYNLVVMDTAPKRKTERHVCDTCGKMYTATRLLIHIKTVHGGVRSAHCEICGKGFISGALLRRHMTVHTGDKLYKCDLCDKSLSQLSALHRHKKNVHKVHSPVCQVCNRCFQTEESLQNHVRITHTNKTSEIKPAVSCSVCGRTYFRRKELQKHIRKAHTDRPLEFECDECDKKFTTKGDLRQHFFRVHNHNKSKNDDKRFTCIVCEMVFISSNKLEKHRTQCCRAYTCGVCKKQCVSSASLSRHITIQHLNVSKGSNKLRKTCETCGKKLKDSWALRQHVKIHSSPVSCDTCGLKFKQRHNLINHRRRTSCMISRKTKSKNNVEKPESNIEDNRASLGDIKKEVTSVGSLNSDVGKLLSQKDIKMEIDNDVESFFYDRQNHLSLKDDVTISFDNCDLSLGCDNNDFGCFIPGEDIKVEVENGLYYTSRGYSKVTTNSFALDI